MPAVVRLNKKGLADLIDNIKENGGDATELENLMAEVNEDENARRPVRRIGNPLRIMVEEPTTEERLEAKVGGLFPGGITKPILTEIIEFDRNHTLGKRGAVCLKSPRSLGISISTALSSVRWLKFPSYCQYHLP